MLHTTRAFSEFSPEIVFTNFYMRNWLLSKLSKLARERGGGERESGGAMAMALLRGGAPYTVATFAGAEQHALFGCPSRSQLSGSILTSNHTRPRQGYFGSRRHDEFLLLLRVLCFCFCHTSGGRERKSRWGGGRSMRRCVVCLHTELAIP